MRGVRARLIESAALVLALFVSSITTPRAGLYFHHHAGGDQPHVHLDDDASDHDHTGAEPHHHHHAQVARPTVKGPVFEVPDDDTAGHWHSQDFFHRAVASTLTAAWRIEAVQFVHIAAARTLGERVVAHSRIRGPPRVA